MINNTLRVYIVFKLTLLFDIYHTNTDDKQYLTGINCLKLTLLFDIYHTKTDDKQCLTGIDCL